MPYDTCRRSAGPRRRPAGRARARRYRWRGLGGLDAALARLRALPLPLQAYGDDLSERRERSLMHTAQRFVQLFLAAEPPRILTLEAAAHALIGAAALTLPWPARAAPAARGARLWPARGSAAACI